MKRTENEREERRALANIWGVSENALDLTLQKVEAARQRYGSENIMPYHESRAILRAAPFVCLDDNLGAREKIDAAILFLRARFSESVEHNGFSLDHPDFPTFAAMLLHKHTYIPLLTTLIHDEMTEMYGRVPGIRKGRSFWCKHEVAIEYIPLFGKADF